MNKHSRLVCSLILAAFSTITVFAQVNLQQPLTVDNSVKIGKLSNGLTYYIRKNVKPAKRVELRLVVNAGSILEDDDQQGLAHFMEHMNFNGTKRFPKNELVSYLQTIGVEFGADLNAYTGFDETVYILPVPTDKPGLVDKGLQILEDWAHNALLDSVEIEKERGVVIEEWRLGRGPDERMMRQSLPVQYKGSKYVDRIPIGTKENLEHFPQSALRRFYKEWYRPDLQAVIVVGDIDVNAIEQKIKQYFGNIPAPASPRRRELFPVPDQEGVSSVVAKDKEAAFPTVEIMFKKDKETETTAADYARSINQRLFTGMLNDRFREIAIKPNPPFIGAGSFYGGTYARTKSAYQLFANVSDTGMSNAIATLLEENRRILLYGFTEGELKRQKSQLLSGYETAYNERTKNESSNYVEEYIQHFLSNEPTPGIDWEYNFVKQYLPTVTVDDINKLASQWLTKNNMVITANAPEKEGVKIPTADEIKNIVAQNETVALKPYEDKAVAEDLLDKKKLKPGKVVSQVTNAKLGTTTVKLSNGATIILKPTDFKNDEILFRAFSKGGSSLVDSADYYSALYAPQIVRLSGVGDFSYPDITKILKGKNTGVATAIEEYNENVNGSTTPKNIETLLQLTNLYFNAPRRDTGAYTSFTTRFRQQLQFIMNNPDFYFGNEVQQIMTQGNMRGGQLPKPADLDKVNLDKALQIYKQRFGNAADFTFFFVGSFNVKEMIPLLEQYIGSLPGNPQKEMYKDWGVRPPSGAVDKLVKKGSEPQARVVMTFTGPATYSTRDAYALESFGDILNIKLTEQLREEKGNVYAFEIDNSITRIPYGAYNFTLVFPCAPEKVDTITTATLTEIEKIKKNGITANDLEKIKEQQKRKLEVAMKQNNFWIDNLYDDYLYGNNPESILQKMSDIDHLTSKMIQDAAIKYLNTKKYIRIYLVPEKVAEKDKSKAF